MTLTYPRSDPEEGLFSCKQCTLNIETKGIQHVLQLVDAGPGSHECLLLLTHPVAVSTFVICSGLCACREML